MEVVQNNGVKPFEELELMRVIPFNKQLMEGILLQEGQTLLEMEVVMSI